MALSLSLKKSSRVILHTNNKVFAIIKLLSLSPDTIAIQHNEMDAGGSIFQKKEDDSIRITGDRLSQSFFSKGVDVSFVDDTRSIELSIKRLPMHVGSKSNERRITINAPRIVSISRESLHIRKNGDKEIQWEA